MNRVTVVISEWRRTPVLLNEDGPTNAFTGRWCRETKLRTYTRIRPHWLFILLAMLAGCSTHMVPPPGTAARASHPFMRLALDQDGQVYPVTNGMFAAHRGNYINYRPGNAGATVIGIEIIKQRREFFQNGVQLAFDGAQRMLRRHTLVKLDDGQKIRLSLRFSTHPIADVQLIQPLQSNGRFSINC